MSRVVVILPTSTYRAGDFIEAGSGLGVDLLVASEGDAPLEMGDGYIQITCSRPEDAAEAIVRAGDTRQIDGIVAADDAGVVVAALAGSKLGLLANDPEAARATRDKALLRARLSAAEVPQPPWRVFDAKTQVGEIEAELEFPVVVKPTSLSAGQGVIRVDHPGQLRQAIERARTIASSEGSSADRIVVETLIHGDEVALEGMVTDRGLTTLAIFDKPDPGLSGDGFQETILVTPSRQPPQTQTEIERVAAQSIRALGLTRGPVHVEMIVSGDRVDVIEVAARSIGGLCSRSLDFGLMDTSLETLILRNAIGRDKPELRRSGGASGVLMIPIPSAGELMSVAGLERVREIPEVSGVDITARPGDRLAPPPEGGRYVGFVFARSQRPEDVERALRDAMKLIEVKIR